MPTTKAVLYSSYVKMKPAGLVLLLAALAGTAGAELVISEICPKPAALDANGRESGWVELYNAGEVEENLADYELVVRKRGKKTGAQGGMEVNLAPRAVAPGAYTLVYTSEMYPNAEDYGGDGSTVFEYDGGQMVFPTKVSAKKHHLVELYKGTAKKAKTRISSFVIPVDLPDGASIAPCGGAFPAFTGGGVANPAGVTRAILPHPTPGAANTLAGAIASGPAIGPLYGVKHDLDDWEAFPVASAGADYTVAFYANAIDAAAERVPEQALTAVRLLYRIGFGNVVTGTVMTATAEDATGGRRWEGTIPAAALPAPGGLVRWAALLTDAAGNTWRAPSLNNPDDCAAWYGTIVGGHALDSATLQTFHLFVENDALSLMDRQYDSIASAHPLGARCGVYDALTGRYYDNVRIDLRGGTTAGNTFRKKSHGLRFNKAQPLTCTDPVTGTVVDGVRKTSFIAEYSDPATLRQSLAMYVRRQNAQPVPFNYPVRLNLNGAFFELAWNSNRFTDEYIGGEAGLDANGYAYKGCGPMAGNGEVTTPEVGGADAARRLSEFANSFSGVTAIGESYSGDGMASEIPSVTRAVVRAFDLPAWLNFLAFSRLTSECDDVWANMCAYCDFNPTLPKRGATPWTGTWQPLAYDMHLSWGAWFYNDDSGAGKIGCRATDDRFKSHPFYGGLRVRCHNVGGSVLVNGNRAIEAVWQSPKFRRLYLRRLRTVMDGTLGAPGTPREATPFWGYVTTLLEACAADDALDNAKWGYGTGTPIYPWPREMGMAEGVEDMWNNYVVPRRQHLFVTHAVNSPTRGIGYGRDLSAGIPNAQRAWSELRGGLSVEECEGGAVIRNANDEAIDLTGWTLSGVLAWTLPAGTVVDSVQDGVPGEVFVVTNRLAYVTAHAAELSDQVIVGNALPGAGRLRLASPDGSQTVTASMGATLALACTPGLDYREARLAVTVADYQPDEEARTMLWVTAFDAAGQRVGTASQSVVSNGVYAIAMTDLVPGGAYTFQVELMDERDEEAGVALGQTERLVRMHDGWIDEDAGTLFGGSAAKWTYEPAAVQSGAQAGESAVALSARTATETAATFTPPTVKGTTYTLEERVLFKAPGRWSAAQEQNPPKAAIRVVAAAGEYRFACYGSGGWHTNTAVVAALDRFYTVRITLDEANDRRVAYALVEGARTIPLYDGLQAEGNEAGVQALEFAGSGMMAALAGRYGDVNVAAVQGEAFESVSEAVARANGSAVTLLHDATFAPGRADVFCVNAAGYTLVLAGEDFGAFAGWAAKHPEVLDGSRAMSARTAKVSSMLDLSGLVSEETLAVLATNGVSIVRADRRETASGVAVEVTLKAEGLPVGEAAEAAFVQRIFGILGAPEVNGSYAAENVLQEVLPVRESDGAVTFRVKAAPDKFPHPAKFFFRGQVRW